ncbi:MAG: HAD family phosphatase [Chloroflexi bacterium]|jgi:HAD superfamily hydrolase (TIGR01509 family)|nr:HAD family phosphatase [Chloroflexota bacterium]
MIRAIVWDWGGVFQRTEDHGPRHALDAALGLEPGSVERAVFESAVWEQASIGRCPAEEAWTTIVAALGYPLAQIDAFVAQFFAGDHVDPTLVDLTRWMRAQGLIVGLLSNAPPGRSASANAAARWGMEGLFDVQVFSYEVGALKPDPRMYAAILQKLGVAPAEALFIDDSPKNVAGAEAVGMQAIRFTGVPALLAELRERGLPTPPDPA